MDKRYIELEKAKETFVSMLCARDVPCKNCNIIDRCLLYKTFDKIPIADVAPVRHGRWKNAKGEFRDCEGGAVFILSATCSVCGRQVNEAYWHGNPPKETPYCPNCGAKMDEKMEGEK